MTRARKDLINLDSTPYYHIISRCVRRTFLCGTDRDSGRDYSHRKQWIVDRLKYLSKIFAIDIAAYAVMSNHYHLVLHVNRDLEKKWSDAEVISRYKLLYKSKTEEIESIAELNPKHPRVAKALVEWRTRLIDISWFMKCINEPIARASNKEDECTGHFWEGRFKSQALLDEGALLSAMAYVDLNPIRANLCATPEESEHTSIKERIEAYRDTRNKKPSKANPQPKDLMAFKCNNEQDHSFIPFNLEDYIKLVDETGRQIRNDKQGFIPKHLAPILSRIDLNVKGWFNITKHLESLYAHVIGNEQKLVDFCTYLRPPKGVRASRALYCE